MVLFEFDRSLNRASFHLVGNFQLEMHDGRFLIWLFRRYKDVQVTSRRRRFDGFQYEIERLQAGSASYGRAGRTHLFGVNGRSLIENSFKQRDSIFEGLRAHFWGSMQDAVHLGPAVPSSVRVPSASAIDSQRDILEAKDPRRIMIRDKDPVHVAYTDLHAIL